MTKCMRKRHAGTQSANSFFCFARKDKSFLMNIVTCAVAARKLAKQSSQFLMNIAPMCRSPSPTPQNNPPFPINNLDKSPPNAYNYY